jgi:uncharacterized damage-inducible protein DinB
MKTISLNTNEYVAYQKMYLDLVEAEQIVTLLDRSLKDFVGFINGLPDDMLNYAYQEGKWTIKELILHMIDTERIFQYRALRFSRDDKTILPGFSENDFVSYSNANSRTKESLLAEYRAVRESTIVLYKTFSDEVLLIVGSSSGGTMSVRGLGYLIVGHQAHHVNVIKERYLN